MISSEFIAARKRLAVTQKKIADLLGVSIKAVHSYEQGWRRIPPHVERQIFFLLSRLNTYEKTIKPCWIVKKCPTERKLRCPAWEFQAGKLCWFINGTICECEAHETWRDKMSICRRCIVLADLLEKAGINIDATDD